jgi:hypothetical protein
LSEVIMATHRIGRIVTGSLVGGPVVALAGHGLFDSVHGYIIENAGMPT